MPGVPLRGIRVVTLGEVYPAPFAAMILVDLGAEVIKVERPGGDPAQAFPGLYHALNRGQRIIELDLAKPVAVQEFHELLRDADLLIDGFRPGALARRGLGEDALRSTHPQLIYCALTAFGERPQMRERAAHDLQVQALAGAVIAAQPTVDAPSTPALPLGDIAGGVFAVVGILAALLERERSGDILPVHVSMLDSLHTMLATELTPRLTGDSPAPMPPADPGYGVFETLDSQFVTLGIGYNDAFWSTLCAALSLGDLQSLKHRERVSRRETIVERLRSTIRQHTLASIASVLTPLDVPFAPVRSLDEAAQALGADPHAPVRRTATGQTFVASPVIFRTGTEIHSNDLFL